MPYLAPQRLVLADHSLVPFLHEMGQPHRTRPPTSSRHFPGRRQGTLFHCYYTLLPISFTVRHSLLYSSCYCLFLLCYFLVGLLCIFHDIVFPG